MWCSKLQMQIALSTTEAEYIALSQSLRDTIPLMQLLEEIKSHGHRTLSMTPKVHCKAFEDNTGAIELACLPKMHPCTKHINVVYHHFRDYVCTGQITVETIKSTDQIADILTKPLAQNLFQKLHKQMLHW